MTTKELRAQYISFFEKQQHVPISSCPLMPDNDPTTLFTGSGMQPLVPYLLGEKHPCGKRLTDSQKCFRSQDIDDVGDNRHTTFFEMLGNWSLGDYFKEKQIPWIFEFLTKTVGLNPERLYVTVFRGNEDIGIPRDDVAIEIWEELFQNNGLSSKVVHDAEINGMQGGRIFSYDETKNWWSRTGVPQGMPVGEPGGPDSEIFWDFGADLNIHENSEFKDEVCHVNCDCGRFLEIGNSVFMQYIKTDQGFEPLPNKNVDFGGGLERIKAALDDNPDVFLIDVFEPIKHIVEKLSGEKYGDDEVHTTSFRVIMDHLRGATFLIGMVLCLQIKTKDISREGLCVEQSDSLTSLVFNKTFVLMSGGR